MPLCLHQTGQYKITEKMSDISLYSVYSAGRTQPYIPTSTTVAAGKCAKCGTLTSTTFCTVQYDIYFSQISTRAAHHESLTMSVLQNHKH